MDATKIKETLDAHGAWLKGDAGQRANLQDADLRGADLRGADLWDANLQYANLWGADLRGANLQGANLWGADLWDANLQDANLRGANLRDVNLQDANLWGADLSPFQIPQEGELIVFKKCREGIVKLSVPPGARRTASLVGRKCRAEFVRVIETPQHRAAYSCYSMDVVYEEGQTVCPDKYDPDIRVECSHGIHFFLTREEAEAF